MSSEKFPSVERKWLSLYEPREDSLLAKRISRSNSMLSMASEEEVEQDAGALPFELWLSIALHMGAAASRLAEVCWGLRPLSRHPELWEALCKAAFPLECGFRDLDARSFGWSWRNMYMTRRRLRFDGLYYITTVKVMMGCQEGRGMKEAGKDFYRGPLAVTYHRIFRFFPSGDCWVYLTSQHPHDSALRKTARSAVTPARRASIRRLNGACWGRFDVREDADGRATTLRARVPLRDPAYPNMAPHTICYEMALLGETRPALSNCDLHLEQHACLSDRPPHDEQFFDVPQPVCSFVSFVAGGRSRDGAAAAVAAADAPVGETTDGEPSAAAPSSSAAAAAGPSFVTSSS